MPENIHFLFAGGFAELIRAKEHHDLFLLLGTSDAFSFYEDK